MTLTKYYRLEELVPPEVIKALGQSAQWCVDPVQAILMDFICDHFTRKATINNWHEKGPYSYRGFRPRSYSGGGELSMHRISKATDFSFSDLTPKEVHAEILKNEKLFMDKGLTTLENLSFTTGKGGPGWTHADSRWTGLDHILIVKP